MGDSKYTAKGRGASCVLDAEGFVVSVGGGGLLGGGEWHRCSEAAGRQGERGARIRRNLRAYLLYSEAVKRDPHNPSYRISRDVLADAAGLVEKTEAEKPDISGDIKAAEQEADAATQETAPANPTIKDERGRSYSRFRT